LDTFFNKKLGAIWSFYNCARFSAEKIAPGIVSGITLRIAPRIAPGVVPGVASSFFYDMPSNFSSIVASFFSSKMLLLLLTITNLISFILI
jgi:hypothetical protein